VNGWLSLRVPAEDDEWLQNQPVWRWLELVISSPAISAQPNRLSVFA